jgi:peptidyl-prolyl cis-trans isomerase SurA
MKNMKFVTLFLATLSVSVAADVGVIEEIIAKVNGDIVTRGDLDRARKGVAAELQQQGFTSLRLQQALAEHDKDVLRDRIDQLLLQHKGKELDIKIDTDVTKYILDLQKKSGISDPEKFQAYVQQETGMPFEDYKADIRNGMLTQRVIRQEVGKSINIKKDELQAYYDAHKTEYVRQERVFLREILVSTDGKDAAGMAAAEKKAKDLVARARKGERFAEMARDNSDAVTAKEFGDLGGFKKGELQGTLENAVWSHPKGYVADPVKVDNGYLILKVEEHQKEGQADLADVEAEIMDKMYAPRMQPAVREYLTKLRQDAFLEIKAGWVDTGAAPGKNTAWSDPAQLKPETTTKAEVANRPRRKKLLWAVPIPGTQQKQTSSSSK